MRSHVFTVFVSCLTPVYYLVLSHMKTPELWFAKRCIKFIKMALISENNTVCTISNMGQYSRYSIMGANIKLFNAKYCMDERNVYATWRDMCEKNEDVIRICMQVKELVDMTDKYVDTKQGGM